MNTVPAWVAMWTVAGLVYVGCKWLTWHTAARMGTHFREAAYLLAWPGLDAPRAPGRLLCHLPFVAGVVVPFMRAMGAIS